MCWVLGVGSFMKMWLVVFGVDGFKLGFKFYIVNGMWEEFRCGDLVIRFYCDMIDVVS